MGLDFSHGGGFLWSYSSYGDFIRLVQVEAERTPTTERPDPIDALLAHSDCEGYFEPSECGPIAKRLLEIVFGSDAFDERERKRAKQMAEGMLRAEKRNERFLYL